MTTQGNRRAAGVSQDAASAAASARLETLFAALDRLTPDELAHIGFVRPPDEERDDLLEAVVEAARRSGRVALVDEARQRASEAVLRRYADGSFHPTFVGLNWGLSQGRVEDRVAIAEALADAAAAVVVEDLLEPAVAEALMLDARQITALAAGVASEASFDRVVRQAEDPELRSSPTLRAARVTIAAVVAVLAGGSGLVVAGAQTASSAGTAIALVALILVVAMAVALVVLARSRPG